MVAGGVADGKAVGLSVGVGSSTASANAGAVSERVNKVAEATNRDRRMVFFEADTIEKLQGS
jgi:predicted regulator of amino acid metabolism with ACT domain